MATKEKNEPSEEVDPCQVHSTTLGAVVAHREQRSIASNVLDRGALDHYACTQS
jgi:hypothetical protein